MAAIPANRDPRTVEAFGDEWSSFDQARLPPDERQRRFWEYFRGFPFDRLATAEGFDLGCGSGRWSGMIADRVGKLHCIEPAAKALTVARAALGKHPNITFHNACADTIPLRDGSQDFGCAIGVLHHTPGPEAALRACTRKLKPGGTFLLYVYYDLQNRPAWFRTLWMLADLVRRLVSRLPLRPRRIIADCIAALVYFPLARLARLAGSVNFPLAAYANRSFYSMRTDALDRFGTLVEHRFSRDEVRAMMERCGLTDIAFVDGVFWAARGIRKAR